MGSIKLKNAQEEMVGFALIVAIVAVIALIFLGIYLSKPHDTSAVNDYKVESFISAMMGYTTECQKARGVYQSVQELLRECRAGNKCLDGEDTCDVLKQDMQNLVDAAWPVNKDSPYKGYEIMVADSFSLVEGEKTRVYRSAESASGNVNVTIYE